MTYGSTIVSADGTNEPSCLSNMSTTHCKTIQYAIDHGVLSVCVKGALYNIHDNITLDGRTGIDQNIKILCEECVLDNCTVTISGGVKNYEITFGNIIMMKCHLILMNSKVSFLNASLKDVNITNFADPLVDASYEVNIKLEQCHFFCNQFYFVQCGLHLTGNTMVNLVSIKSTIQYYNINISVVGIALFFYQTEVIQTNLSFTITGFFRMPGMIQFDQVSFDDSENVTYQSNAVDMVVQYPVIQIENCVFRQKSLTIRSTGTLYKNIYFASISIHKTSFIGGRRAGKGGALFVHLYRTGSKVLICECSFLHNTAIAKGTAGTSYGGAIYVDVADNLNEVGILQNLISMINVHNMLALTIRDSHFVDNFASSYGTALHVSDGVSVSVVNSTFNYDIKPKDPPLNSIVSVAGSVEFFDGSIHLTNENPDSHTHGIEVMYIYKANRDVNLDLNIICPRWYNYVTKYSYNSASEIQLMLQCQPCIKSFFRNVREDVHYQFDGNISLFVKNMNGDIDTCQSCPYGAVCSGNNVVPRPNHWGFWNDDKLVFVKCTPNYCCSGTEEEPCVKYNHCAGNRTGQLCGSCLDGFSMSILTGKCVPDRKCGRIYWFWLVAFCAAMAYAMWYTFLGNIFEPFFNLLFVKSCKAISKNIDRTQRKQGKTGMNSQVIKVVPIDNPKFDNFTYDVHATEKSGIDTSHAVIPSKEILDDVSNVDNTKKPLPTLNKGYFGIFNNFVQMAAAMKVQVEYNSGDKSIYFLDWFTEFIHSFISVNVSKLSPDICPIVGLTFLGKHIYDLIFTFSIYACWLLIFVLIFILPHGCYIKICPMFKAQNRLKSLQQTLVKGLIKIMKFTYAKICSIIFMSVMCTPLGRQYVWKYDATNVCLETWQILMMVFGVSYALPFPFALYMAMRLLNGKQINGPLFIAFCLCPGGALFFLMVKLSLNIENHFKNVQSPTDTTDAMLSVLQGPYKKDPGCKLIYWEAMVFLRRLLTTITRTIGPPSVQLMILVALWAFFLVQHVYLYPFEVKTSNHLETLSLFFLLLVAAINLLKAFLADSSVILSGPITVPFMQALEALEKTMIIILLVFILFIEFRFQRSQKKNK